MAKPSDRLKRGYGWGYNAVPGGYPEQPKAKVKATVPKPPAEAPSDYASDRERGYGASDDDYGPQILWEPQRKR